MFAFKDNSKEPEFSLNHENTPYTSCFGKDEINFRSNIGSTTHDLEYNSFLEWTFDHITRTMDITMNDFKKI